MEVDKLIEEAINSLKRERKIMGLLLKCEEKDETSKFKQVQEYYKNIKDRTDAIIKYLKDNCDIENLVDKLSSKIDMNSEESIDAISLITFLTSDESKMFVEEHNKVIYFVYLWALKSGYIDKDIQESIHNFMKLRFADSQFLRNYYSGNYDEAEKVSNPDGALGRLMASDLALVEYNMILNAKVNEANCSEVFDDFFDKDIVKAKKTLLEIELASICFLSLGKNKT